MDALVSRALMIRLSLQPSPDSETSAFSNIRAFSNRCAGLFPFRISASSCSRSSALNRTTYLFTEISFAAMIASVVPTVDDSESSNPFNLVEAGDYLLRAEHLAIPEDAATQPNRPVAIMAGADGPQPYRVHAG